MVRIYINGNPVHAREDATILEASFEDKYASKQFDLYIPTIQYLKGVQECDASGLPMVEVKGVEGLVNAASIRVTADMEVTTNSPAAIAAQKEALAAILKEHDVDCRHCVRTGNCELQNLQWHFRLNKPAAEARNKTWSVDEESIIIRDENKCVRCGRCVAACTELQGIGAIERRADGRVLPLGGGKLSATKCVSCGQCITVCPVGALRERDDTDRILAAIADPEKFVVIQAAPSVRASVGEYFQYPVGAEVEGKLAAALRRLGFDRVFDTTFGADLTIMEEAAEFLERQKSGSSLPLITSCCPSWVQFCEQEFPALLPHVSSCKSPQQMFGAVIKSWYAEKLGLSKENIVVVSAMPCTAKKFELTREGQAGAGVPGVDFSITARELCRMLERQDVAFMSLPDEDFDSPLGQGSGAGVIFGATGGVMEAALRTAADWISGEKLERVEYSAVRGVAGVKEAEVTLNGSVVRIAAVSGLANARALMEKVAAGQADYAFIEVMACPGGCVNGGGQPQQISSVHMTKDLRAQRASTLYGLDEHNALRKAHDNPEVQELYRSFLSQPGSQKAHALLHTTYHQR